MQEPVGASMCDAATVNECKDARRTEPYDALPRGGSRHSTAHGGRHVPARCTKKRLIESPTRPLCYRSAHERQALLGEDAQPIETAPDKELGHDPLDPRLTKGRDLLRD